MVSALIKIWSKSISTADGLGDLDLKQRSEELVRQFVAKSS